MTWEEQLFALFDDLEQQADALYDAERGAELADRSRSAYAEVTLAGRLMAAVGADLAVDLRGVGSVTGRLERAAAGWFLLSTADQDWVVRTDAVLSVLGAPARAVPDVAWSPVARLGLGSALRRLAEAAEPCLVHGLDGRQDSGILRRVGQDFVELATGPDGSRVALVPFAGLAAVQSRR
ncbi:MAG: hypothetical protein LH468_02850 [Nocardioides sp.]|nr:hypothetical protein [Nocardioides sp.]